MLTRAAKIAVTIHLPIVYIHIKIISMICYGVSLNLLQFTKSGAQVSRPYVHVWPVQASMDSYFRDVQTFPVEHEISMEIT